MRTNGSYPTSPHAETRITPRGQKVIAVVGASLFSAGFLFGACAGPEEAGPQADHGAPAAERTCNLPAGNVQTFELKSGGLLLKGEIIYPENPNAGVQAIIDANPQFGITNPDIVPAGTYLLPECTPIN